LGLPTIALSVAEPERARLRPIPTSRPPTVRWSDCSRTEVGSSQAVAGLSNARGIGWRFFAESRDAFRGLPAPGLSCDQTTTVESRLDAATDSRKAGSVAWFDWLHRARSELAREAQCLPTLARVDRQGEAQDPRLKRLAQDKLIQKGPLVLRCAGCFGVCVPHASVSALAEFKETDPKFAPSSLPLQRLIAARRVLGASERPQAAG
jgi:hypothetical protein